MWTDDDETSNKLGEVSEVDSGNITSHSIADDPVPFFRKFSPQTFERLHRIIDISILSPTWKCHQ